MGFVSDLLKNPADIDAFRRDGYSHSAASWTLQYLGPDKGSATVFRFSIADLSGSSDDERIGQVEYVHDLSKGREFVVRGVRVTILDVRSDGIVTFVAKYNGSGV